MEPKQYYIGIDVGGTSVKEGLFDEDGNLLAKASVPTPPIVDAAGFAAVTEAIDQVVAKAQNPRAFVAGNGLAVPCPIPASGDAKVKANIAINLPELRVAIQKHCPDAVVKYENDANAAAMGEAWLGSAKGVQNVVMVTIGTGVGGGVIVNGDVVSGVVGAGGEIGHMCLNPAEERTCGCGGHGHLEQYSSATGVVSNYLAECKKAGVEPIELTGPSDSKDVFQACREGDKIALVGRNGEGKTTLARMLIGQLTPTEGSVRLGANVNIGYYAQNQDDLMDGEFTVYDTLDRVAVGDIRTRLRDILGAFLFRGEDIDKKVKVLSGGERARLAMARMMLEPRNLLVLDEPTNHMDMRSKDILKNAIMKYDGTVVVVSHDREFLDGMVEKVYEFRDGGVKEYLGGIYYFLEKRKLESLQEIERRDAPAKMPAKGDEPKPAVSGKLSYEQRKEQEKQLRKAKKVVETIEAELADIEKRIAEYDARFAAATEYNEADYKAYNELKTRYDHQMHEWEKASYELEIIENE